MSPEGDSRAPRHEPGAQSAPAFTRDTGPGLRCRECREPLHPNARRCASCGAFQNWRRFLALSSTVLSLLVALISVSALAIPILKEAFEPQHSRVAVEAPFFSGDFGYLYVANEGARPALVESIVLTVHRFDVMFAPRKLSTGDGADASADPRILRAETTEIYRLDRGAPADNGLLVDFHPVELEAYLDEVHQWSIAGISPRATTQTLTELPDFMRPELPLDAAPTERTVGRLEALHTDIRAALYRLQRIAADLSFEAIRELDADELFDIRSFDDVRAWAESRVDQESWDEGYAPPLDRQTFQAYAEAVRILRFLDEALATGTIELRVKVRHSDGRQEGFVIPLAYPTIAAYVRPLMLGPAGEDKRLAGLFHPL